MGIDSQLIQRLINAEAAGGAASVADGADVTQGALADAAVAAGAAGSLSAKLRAISRDLVANIVLAAGTAIIGKVGIDQTTPGTTNAVVATGSVASGAADGGNPLKIGGVVKTSAPGALVAGNRADAISDGTQRLITHPYAMRELTVSGVTAAITDTTSTQIVASAGASTRNFVTTLTVVNSHATVGTLVNILDAGGSTLWTAWAGPLSSQTMTFPMPLRCGVAVALNAQCVTTGANVIVSAVAFKWT